MHGSPGLLCRVGAADHTGFVDDEGARQGCAVAVDVQIRVAVEGQHELLPVQRHILAGNHVARVEEVVQAAGAATHALPVALVGGKQRGIIAAPDVIQAVQQRRVGLPELVDAGARVDAEGLAVLCLLQECHDIRLLEALAGVRVAQIVVGAGAGQVEEDQRHGQRGQGARPRPAGPPCSHQRPTGPEEGHGQRDRNGSNRDAQVDGGIAILGQQQSRKDQRHDDGGRSLRDPAQPTAEARQRLPGFGVADGAEQHLQADASQRGQSKAHQEHEAARRAQQVEAGQQAQPAVRDAVDAQRQQEADASDAQQGPGVAVAPAQERQRGQRQRQDADVAHLDARPQPPVQLRPAAEEAGDHQADPLGRRDGVADCLLIAPRGAGGVLRELDGRQQHRRGDQDAQRRQQRRVAYEPQRRLPCNDTRLLQLEEQPEQPIQHHRHPDEQRGLDVSGQRSDAQQQAGGSGPGK